MTILPKPKKNQAKTKKEGTSKSAYLQEKTSTSKAYIRNREETYNSDDECGAGFKNDELEDRFADRLKRERGFCIKEVKGDGACMFRAIADQIYGDEEMHGDIRRLCMDYIANNRDHFSQFLTEDFERYLTRKRQMDAYGNHVELQAISEIFLRPIEIYEYSTNPINTFHPISPEAYSGNQNPPFRLSYHSAVHYNSVIDPYSATIGVGLGLPDFKPGMADKNLLKEAKLASEVQHIEEAMLNDKLKMTDWEKTEEELSQQVAKESYLEYLREIEQKGEKNCEEKQQLKNSVVKTSTTIIKDTGINNKSLVQTSRQQQRLSLSGAGQKSTPLYGTKKRGASSPNIPCCSRDEKNYNFPLAKIQKNDASSISLPNIKLNVLNDNTTFTLINNNTPSTSTTL